MPHDRDRPRVAAARDRKTMHRRARMMRKQHSDCGLERILREPAPLQALGHGAEGMNLPAVTDQQVPRREIGHSEILRGVDLEALVHDQSIAPAQCPHGARARMVRIGKLPGGAHHHLDRIGFVWLAHDLDVREREGGWYLDAAGRHVCDLTAGVTLCDRPHQAEHLLVGRSAHRCPDAAPAALGDGVDNEATLAGAGHRTHHDSPLRGEREELLLGGPGDRLGLLHDRRVEVDSHQH